MTWADVWGGVVAGLIATAIWVFVDRSRRFIRVRRKFGRYAGCYLIAGKEELTPRPERVAIEVKGNVLAIEFENLPPGDSVSGRIVMDELLRGEGHYRHVKGGVQLWGFWDIQVRDKRTLLVHTTFSRSGTDTLVLEGFRWERTEAS